ncbi:MAG: SDR family oxidoreductase [Gammaproteobacteria bacterium]|nr:SDR family oxidoreductase [Gammaproteobacteria bacterium]
MRFHNKRVVITGGVGGIGQALIQLFSQQGANVLFTDRSEEDCAEFTLTLEARGTQVDFVSADLRSKVDCENIIDTAIDTMGGVDILLNNAGVIPRGTILETSDDMWFSALDINLTAAFYLCREVIPHMQKNGGGAIVNTSSTWGLYPGPGHLAYCTSKAALAALTRNLGRDHAGDGIRVNAVCPNEVDTPMLRSGFTRRGIDPDNGIQELGKTVPLGHVAKPEEIANVIAFLASDESSYVCGETVEVTGAKPVYG